MSHETPIPNTAYLGGGAAIDVAALELAHHRVAASQDGGDHPSTGSKYLGELAGAGFGVWEMSRGTMYDVEAEEIFVVTAGRGSVHIKEFAGTPEREVQLFPGILMRLSEGMKTTWVITKPLRKVYVTPSKEH